MSNIGYGKVLTITNMQMIIIEIWCRLGQSRKKHYQQQDGQSIAFHYCETESIEGLCGRRRSRVDI